MPRPRIAVSLHGLHALFGGDIRRVVDVAVLADEAGIDCVTLPDHVAMGTRTDRYPYGDFPLPADFPWFEPLTLLAAMAPPTKRIRLSTSVLIAPLRPAALLAKICASLDQLSAGRFELGAGTGWQREEYQAVGVPFAGRAGRMVDSLRACRALWSGEAASFSSDTVSFRDVTSVPAPRQPGGVPLWLGMAPTERSCKWFAELGAGWVAMAVKPADLAADVDALRRAYESAGRSPADLRVRAGLPYRLGSDRRPDLIATLDGIDAAVAVGVTEVEIFLSAFATTESALEPALRRIAEHSA